MWSARIARQLGSAAVHRSMSTVSVVGLGAMGLPMAKNLAAATAGSEGGGEGGGEVHVYDLNAGAVSDAASSGCVAAADASSAVRGAKVIVSSLPRSSDVLTVVQSMVTDSSNPELFAKGAIWEPEVSRQISDLLAEHDVHYLDAGVAGGPRGAKAGNLAAMVGGDADVLAAVLPTLEHIMGKVVHIGPTGAGHAVKSVNNTLLASHIVVAAEGLTTLVKQGVPVDKALEAINAASGRSLVTEERIPDHVLSGAFDFGFAMNLMNKDVGICIAQLDANQLEHPVLRLVAKQFAKAEAEYGPDAEHMHVISMYEAAAGGAEIRAEVGV
eukprot:gene9690-28840_t